MAGLDLFETMQAQFVTRSGQRMLLGGFKSLNREKLRNLPGEALSQLARSGDLDLIYATLHSMRNFTPLAERLPVEDVKDGAGLEAPAAA